MSQNSSRGWVVTFAGTGINLALGVLYTWSIFSKALVGPPTSWSKFDASIPYTLAIAMFALMMVPAGRLQDKLGPRLVATVGGALLGGGLIVAGLMPNFWGIVIGFGLMSGAGIGIGYASATPAAVKWFGPEKKGLITGLVVSGFGLAPVYIAPLTNSMIGQFGVQQSFFYLGIAFTIIAVSLAQLLTVPDAPAAAAPARGKGASPAPAFDPHNYEWTEMIKTPQFYMLWLMFAFSAVSGLMIIGHLASIVKAQSGQDWGFYLVALMAIFNAGGRIVAGVASDKIGRTRTMLIMFVLQAIVMGLFGTFSSGVALGMGAAVVGFNYGAALALFPSATSDFFGTKNLGANYGILFTSWGVGGVFGPMLAGAIADATKSYNTAYMIAAGLCVVGAIIAAITKAPKARTASSSIARGA